MNTRLNKPMEILYYDQWINPGTEGKEKYHCLTGQWSSLILMRNVDSSSHLARLRSPVKNSSKAGANAEVPRSVCFISNFAPWGYSSCASELSTAVPEPPWSCCRCSTQTICWTNILPFRTREPSSGGTASATSSKSSRIDYKRLSSFKSVKWELANNGDSSPHLYAQLTGEFVRGLKLIGKGTSWESTIENLIKQGWLESWIQPRRYVEVPHLTTIETN